jgi:hypothetical protein
MANGAIANGGEKLWCDRLTYAFTLAADQLPGWKDIYVSGMSGQEAKVKFVSCTAAGFNAFAGVIHEVYAAGQDVEEAIDRMSTLNWSKENWVMDPKTGDQTNDVFFEGTIVQNARTVSSRTEFETAATKLYSTINATPLPKAKKTQP